MIKRGLIFTAIILTASMLVACGNSYDETIEQVLDWENEELNKPNVEKDFESLEREQAVIKVYDSGNFVEITYNIRSESPPNTWLYDLREGRDRHGNTEDIVNQEPDYEEGEID